MYHTDQLTNEKILLKTDLNSLLCLLRTIKNYPPLTPLNDKILKSDIFGALYVTKCTRLLGIKNKQTVNIGQTDRISNSNSYHNLH